MYQPWLLSALTQRVAKASHQAFKIFPPGFKVWLIAENPEFAPIEVDLKDQELVIEGLSVGVLRR